MTGESGSIEPHLGRCATSADHGELVGGNRESNAVQVRVGHCMKLPSAVRATLAAAAVCGGALPGGTFRPGARTLSTGFQSQRLQPPRRRAPAGRSRGRARSHRKPLRPSRRTICGAPCAGPRAERVLPALGVPRSAAMASGHSGKRASCAYTRDQAIELRRQILAAIAARPLTNSAQNGAACAIRHRTATLDMR
jgi:hypothetical protein